MALSLQQSAAELFGKLRFSVRYPPAAIEIGTDAVAAVRIRSERSGPCLVGFGIAPLRTGAGLTGGAPGAVPAHPVVREDLRRALGEAIASAGIKPGKVSLLIPDSAARVWLLQLPEIPRGQHAVLEMIRWKIRKSIPFRIEDAVIAWQVLSRPSGTEPAVVLVGLIPQVFVSQCEALLASVGLRVGLVDLSSFNLFNAYRHVIAQNGAASEDLGVLNATEGYFTLMFFRGGELIFFRCKAHAEGESGAPEERARTFRREVATSLSYYTEKLRGVSLGRTLARVADPALAEAGETLRSLGFGEIEPIDPSKIARLPEEMTEGTALYLAPAMGAASGRR